MTGYGRGEFQAGGHRAVVECASVNRKQAEVAWSGPRELAAMEPLVREEVLRRVSRGRVAVTADVQFAEGSGHGVDIARARAYARSLRSLARALDIPDTLSLETILAGPGVMKGASVTGAWPAVRGALRAALDGLVESRAREGAALAKTLRTRISAMERLVRKVAPLARRVPARQRGLLEKRLAAAGLSITADDPRIAMELGLLAERCDITEELDRIASHLKEFSRRLEETTPAGRALEFLAQELGREWNTLGAKAADAEISRLVLDAKALLEQIREQLANVE